MLFRAFPPHERAKGAAILMIPMVVAPASGPVVGGYLVEYWDWRWIFFVNIPVGVTALIFAWRFLKEEIQPNPGRFDLPGMVLAATGLGSLLYGLAEAGSRGVDDPTVIAFGAVGLVLLAAFTLVELRTAEPMIDMRLFQNRLFATANAVQLVAFAGLTGGLFLLPVFLQSPATLGLGAFDSGLTTFPQAIGIVMMVQISSRLYPRIGPRRLLVAGLLGVTMTTFAFMLIDVGTNLWWIRGIMFARGCFFSFILICLQTATFATISMEKMGRASAISSADRQVGASFGVALVATVLTNRLTANGTSLAPGADSAATVEAFHEAFFVAAMLTLAGAGMALLINDEDAAPSMNPAAIKRPVEEREPALAAGGN
jgi:EmrB/QacA subfamily drug resistance transporter